MFSSPILSLVNSKSVVPTPFSLIPNILVSALKFPSTTLLIVSNTVLSTYFIIEVKIVPGYKPSWLESTPIPYTFFSLTAWNTPAPLAPDA